MIDALASSAHYVDHLAAVLTALPMEERGQVLTSNPAVAQRAESHGLAARGLDGPPERPVLVAAFGDLGRAQRMGRTRIAIMEHGAGQSYGARSVMSGSYAGGRNRDAASLFLHPGNHPAERDRKAYPGARVEVVGSPFLDALPAREGPKGRVVAFTFHFNGALCAETRNAYPHFFPDIAALAERFELLGHGHPMLWSRGRPGKQLADRYRAVGIEPVADFADVCRRADLLIFDNTSVGFAFAATGRPVVVMNAPRYDRRANHGLRFWEASEVGVNCNDPAELGDCIEAALADPPEQVAKREAALDLVYAHREGASQRAAAVLRDWAA